MKTNLFFYLLVLTTIFSACSDDDLIEEEECRTPSNHIDFTNPAEGQTSSYLLLTGEQYFDDNNNFSFEYTGDTLILTVESITSDGILIKEELSEGSTGEALSSWILDIDLPHYITAVIDNDSIQFFPEVAINPASLLFGGHVYNDKLPLTNITENETTIEGWKNGLGYCECDREGFVTDTNLLGYDYERLNIAIRNAEMQVDGPGHTYVYSANEGIVRYSIYSWWSSTGIGWDRLPE